MKKLKKYRWPILTCISFAVLYPLSLIFEMQKNQDFSRYAYEVKKITSSAIENNNNNDDDNNNKNNLCHHNQNTKTIENCQFTPSDNLMQILQKIKNIPYSNYLDLLKIKSFREVIKIQPNTDLIKFMFHSVQNKPTIVTRRSSIDSVGDQKIVKNRRFPNIFIIVPDFCPEANVALLESYFKLQRKLLSSNQNQKLNPYTFTMTTLFSNYKNHTSLENLLLEYPKISSKIEDFYQFIIFDAVENPRMSVKRHVSNLINFIKLVKGSVPHVPKLVNNYYPEFYLYQCNNHNFDDDTNRKFIEQMSFLSASLKKYSEIGVLGFSMIDDKILTEDQK